MEPGFWEGVAAQGHRVPSGRSLVELTTELTVMLGDTDPHVRDELAYPTLATWVGEGVYDDLLEGLGDGMASGLTVGLGEDGTDTVFRRSFSALVLAECVARTTEAGLLPDDVVLRWGDRLAGWLVRERDLRGYVPGKGWAHAVAHGADALGVLAGSPALGPPELTVLLDVVADRLLTATATYLVHGEVDRLAAATVQVLRRDLVGIEVLEPWVARLAAQAGPVEGPPSVVAATAQAFLRALHLQVVLGRPAPPCRADLLLVLVDALRASNPHFLT